MSSSPLLFLVFVLAPLSVFPCEFTEFVVQNNPYGVSFTPEDVDLAEDAKNLALDLPWNGAHKVKGTICKMVVPLVKDGWKGELPMDCSPVDSSLTVKVKIECNDWGRRARLVL